ncbi:MAG: hypothetical protein GX442_24085 [Candidatus Riflebacteria bacterium]|nr:hypothetical protein [Candidatus Riflebacteria bacterium]
MRSRRGSLLVLVLTMVFVGAVLVISLFDVLRERYFQTYRMIDDRMAEHLCQSLLEISNYELQKALLDAGDIRRKIQTLALPCGTEDVLVWSEAASFQDSLSKAMDNYLATFSEGETRTMSVKVRAVHLWLTDVKVLGRKGPGYQWSDPGERIGTFSFHLEISVNAVRKKLVANRAFQIVNHLPGPLGRFTLFVKDASGENYNLLDNDSDGTPVSDRSPLVCYHGTSDQLDKNGFVFLGGDDPLTLRLTQGYGNRRTGEYFHFLAQGQDYDPDFYAGKVFTPPSADAGGVPWVSYLGLIEAAGVPFPVDLKVDEKYFGFYSTSPKGWSVNLLNALDSFFLGQNMDTKSSLLHLEGAFQHPRTGADGRTPTWVLGNVRRLYAIIRLLKFDSLPADGVLGAVAVMKSPVEPATDPDFWNVVNAGLPTTVSEAGAGSFTVSKPFQEEGFSDIFASAQRYLANASTLVMTGSELGEPFNEFLRGYFQDRSDLAGKVAIDEGRKMVLQFAGGAQAGRSGEAFSGDLSRIPPDLLEYKALLAITRDRFLKRYASGNKLALRVPVLVTDEEDTLSLPSLEVAEGTMGTLFFAKDIALDGLTSKTNALDAQGNLNFCSLGGDITLASTQEYQANFLALDGTLRPAGVWNIWGNACVGKLPAAALERGGRLEYNPFDNPESPSYGLFDGLYLSDRYHAYSLSSE